VNKRERTTEAFGNEDETTDIRTVPTDRTHITARWRERR
jgi:hypothetical protein